MEEPPAELYSDLILKRSKSTQKKKKELILSEQVFYMAALQCGNLILNQRKYNGFD